MQNFVKYVLDNGGKISPLVIPATFTNGTGLFNPSIYKDDTTNSLLLNLRHCQYTLYHSEKNIYEHEYGPLVYLNPENDITLTTTNYFCTVNKDTLLIESFSPINTKALDVKPIWEFVGLEDCRVVRWDNKLYVSGVRRDTTTNGQGRMELSELAILDGEVKEVSRFRIPAPKKDDSYCEKNWMPVTDMPYHYVKWSNPTEVVKVDPVTKTCTTVYLDESKFVKLPYDYRGGSQVIPYGEHRIALAHTVNLFKSAAGRKNATYRHAFIVWDKDWNVVKYGNQFDFMRGEVEFCAGMTEFEDNILISFGFQDNAAYLLQVPKKIFEDFIYE
jgi:hypothetical protein